MAERPVVSHVALRLDEWRELARDALREISAHKLRSLLTLSGIVFGSASVVAMTSLAAGMRTVVYQELDRMGLPRSFSVSDGSPRTDSRRARDLQHPGMRVADARVLAALPGVESVHPRAFADELVAVTPRAQRRIRVEGVDAGFLELRHWPIVAGRTIVPLDVQEHARVAVIGSELVKDFFGAASPVGRTITLDGVKFTIVGVNAPLPLDLIPADFTWTARRIYIPYTWITRYRFGESRVSEVAITALPGADFARVMHASTATLRQRHRGVEDFEVTNDAAEVAENLALADNVLSGWNGVLYAIAAVTLIVGGIGLFSVLLISVRERVREIGIRKALGADDEEIQRLFLAESLVLAASGSVVGILGGAGLIVITQEVVQKFGRRLTIPIHVPGVVLSIVFAIVVGLVFGWYPARRASRLNPIEAIYEV